MVWKSLRFDPYQVLHEGHGAAPESDGGEEDDDERRGDEDAADVVVELEVEAQRVGDGTAQAGEPHDQHHFLKKQSRPSVVFGSIILLVKIGITTCSHTSGPGGIGKVGSRIQEIVKIPG